MSGFTVNFHKWKRTRSTYCKYCGSIGLTAYHCKHLQIFKVCIYVICGANHDIVWEIEIFKCVFLFIMQILYNRTFIQVVDMILRSFEHFLRLRFWRHPDWIIKDFYFSFHGRSHHSGWPKCVTVLTHKESHWFRFPLHAGCGVECQLGFSGYTYMFATSHNMPISFTIWTTGRCGREPGIVFKLLLLHTVHLLGKH